MVMQHRLYQGQITRFHYTEYLEQVTGLLVINYYSVHSYFPGRYVNNSKQLKQVRKFTIDTRSVIYVEKRLLTITVM